MMKKFHVLLIAFVFLGLSSRAQTMLADERFDAEGIDKVEIRGGWANVYIEDTSGKAVKFEGWIKGPKKYKGDIRIESSLDGSTLVIWVEKPNNTWGNFSAEFKLKVPLNTTVLAKNGSGNMYADGLVGEEISLKCSSGNLEATNLAGNLYLKTSSGNLSGFDLEGNTQATSSSGSLRIDGLVGNLDCRSSSGRIYLTDVSNSIVTAESSSGGVSLDNVNGKLDIESTSGSIRGEDVNLKGDSFFETSSGSINIELENDISSMSFDLKASSGNLKVGSNRSDDRLIIKRGGVQVTGRSSSGSQSYYD